MKLSNIVRLGFVVVAVNSNISAALAQVQPGWNRPIFQSKMVVTDIEQNAWLKDSLEDAKITLLLTKQDGTNIKGLTLSIDQQVILFNQVTETQDGCATLYEGIATGVNGKKENRHIEIKLEDISGCEVTILPNNGTWKATLSEAQPDSISIPETPPAMINALELMGNPETIYSTFELPSNEGGFDQTHY